MIAVDSSSLIAFLRGDEGKDVEALDRCLATRQAVLPPVVISELLSDPKLGREAKTFLTGLPVLDLLDGFWVRAGETRAVILGKGLKAKLADALIAQVCIDHETPLLTRDPDFRRFEKHTGLTLFV
jgi:predicted nucleic acid-binding protein